MSDGLDANGTTVSPPAAFRCQCDQCWRGPTGGGWRLSEVPPVRRTWLAFEVVRPVDVVLGTGPRSYSETELYAEELAS